MNKRRTDKGFTLVEVVVTVVIIGVAVFPLFSIFNSSLDRTQETKVQLLANQLAQQCVESVKAKDYKELKGLDTDKTDGDIVDFILNKDTNATITNFPSVPDGYQASIVLEPEGIYQVTPDNLVIKICEYELVINQNSYELSQGITGSSKITVEYTKPRINEENYQIAIKHNNEEVYKQVNNGFLSSIQLMSGINQKIEVVVDNQTDKAAILEIVDGDIAVESTTGSNQIKYSDTIEYTMTDREIDVIYDGGKITVKKSNEAGDGVLIGEFLVGSEDKSIQHRLRVINNGIGKINVYNQTSKSLDVEIVKDTISVLETEIEVKQGIVKKSYRDARSASTPYMLYRLQVDIKDEKTGNQLISIETTKME